MSSHRLSIVIPAYNEKPTVASLLDRVVGISLNDIEKEIIVVESNSQDGTRAVVQAFEASRKIKAIYQERPFGKGHALKTGLAAATGDLILIQDADLEYEVAEYPKLLEPLITGEALFVLGSRHLGLGWAYRTHVAKTWLFHFINAGAWSYTQLFNVLYGQSLTDPCTMYKVFRRECLEGITLQSNGFDMDWEIVAKMVRKGIRPLEVAVTYRSRSWAEGKKVQLWRDGWASLWAILRFRIGNL